MTSFFLADRINSSHLYANGTTVSVQLQDVHPTIELFLLSEVQSTQPDKNDIRFQPSPATFELSEIGSIATVYLWTKNFIDQLSASPLFATISVLPLEPTAELLLTGRIDQTGRQSRNSADVHISASLGANRYLISESQTTQPSSLTTQIPTLIIFSEVNTLHTAYLWIEDVNGRKNSLPFASQFYSPQDSIVGHRPGLAFLDINKQGLTADSNTLKAVDTFGNYILWEGLNFDPTGKNFSDIKLSRPRPAAFTEYIVQVPADSFTDSALLANHENWEKVTVHIEFPFSNVAIIQNNRVIYTNGVAQPAIRSISVQNGVLEFSPNHFDTIRIVEYSANSNNEVSLQIDEYDFSFLDGILHATPTISADLGSTTDESLNPMLASSLPVTIEIHLSDKEITFLDQFNQLEAVFTGEEVRRIRDFDFVSDYTVIKKYDDEPLFTITSTVCVMETSIIIPDTDFSTSSSNPYFSFDVINPANTFAEFTIQLANNPEFTSPRFLIFRIKETDSRILTLEAINQHEIIFFDPGADPLPYGTIFWRVRRNQSDYSDPASITIRSAPVVRLEFTADSEFIKEIGLVARVKVRAFDAANDEVIGAKIDFDVPHLGFSELSNTNYAGVAPTLVTMPVTIQEFMLFAESEGNTVSHLMTAVDSRHLTSEITFNRIPDPPPPPPVLRYLIFRKLLAEVRDENEDIPLQIDQLPGSPLIRLDSKKPQANVVFDPYNAGLNQAIDIAEPKKVDRDLPIEISNVDCNLKIQWQETEERSTTWFYDGKSVSNQNVRSAKFSDTACGGRKFDIITAFLANNKTITPSPYPDHGTVFPPYIVERFDPNYSVPVTIAASQTAAIDNNNDSGFNSRPNPVSSLTATYSLGLVQLSWTNPSVLTHDVTKDLVYRVKAYDIGGNHSFSQIQEAPDTLEQCIEDVVITRLNSTECFEEIKECTTLDADIILAHGSILTCSLKVVKLPDCFTLSEGTDYSLVDPGDENTGTRAKIVFHSPGIVDVHDRLSISYRYGLSISCGGTPTINDIPVLPDGCNASFVGALAIDSREDQLKVTEPVAYTYGVWIRNKAGALSEGRFVQILISC